MNEDFAPFELAVKLNEKGFDEPCYGYYHCNGGNDSFELCGNGDRDFQNSKNRYRVAAPTIPQVLKWLRKKKIVDVPIETNENGEPLADSWIKAQMERAKAAEEFIAEFRKAMEGGAE